MKERIHPSIREELQRRGIDPERCTIGPSVAESLHEVAAKLHGAQAAKGTVTAMTPTLVEPIVFAAGGVFTAYLPIITRSEANESAWYRKMKRKCAAKRVIREALGPHLGLLVPYAEHFHSGGALRVVLTRLGGRKMDRTVNNPNALKVVEDMIAGAMLIDDGDSRWHCRCEQEPGGPVGVRVEIGTY